MNPQTKALLMAGGLGTRLRPVTERTPKCLVPIAGRPLLDYWVDSLTSVGIYHAVINTHHCAEQVRSYIAHINSTTPMRIEESHEPMLLGSGGTVHANRNLVGPGETCVIIYTDNLSTVDLSGMLQFHHAHEDPLTMMLFRAPHPERCGIATLDVVGRIVGFVEKPKEYVGDLANGGVYVTSAEGYHEMAEMNRFDLASDVLPAFTGRMRGWTWHGYHMDIGTIDALRRANAEAPLVFPQAKGVTV